MSTTDTPVNAEAACQEWAEYQAITTENEQGEYNKMEAALQDRELPQVPVTSYMIDPEALLRRKQSEEWLEERSSYLGATDVAAIVGVHPYKTPLGVFREKKGLEPPLKMNQPMAHGCNLELYVAQCYSRITGRKLHKSRFYRDKKIPYFAANPDYEVRGERPLRLVECKTAGFFAGQIFGENIDSIPDQYLIQCMWQLAITKRQVCDLAVLIGGQDFRIYTIERDEELIKMLKSQADNWWKTYILSDCPPPITGEKPDSEYVKNEYPTSCDNILYAGPDLDDICLELKKAREVAKAAATEEERLTNIVKLAMGSSGELQFSGGKITWKTNGNGSRRFCCYFSK